MNTVETNGLDADPADNKIIKRPLLIIKEVVLFPKILTPITVVNPLALKAIEAASKQDTELVVVTQHDPTIENPAADDVYTVGVQASIVRFLPLPNGSANILLQGTGRTELIEWLQAAPYPIVKGRALPDTLDASQMNLSVEAQMRAVMALFEKVANLHNHIPDDAFAAAANINEPGWLADFISTIIEISQGQRQEILEIVNPVVRLQRLSIILGQELDVLELEDRIQNQVQQSLDKSQREYFLREQIRVMQSELGEMDGSHSEINELYEKLNKLPLPDETKAKAQKELKRLSEMPPMAPEVTIIRTYLDWIIDLPWAKETQDYLDINHAEEILNQNHYGLPRVKERILEYLAVRARVTDVNKLRSPILCFVGPPGTGKTSLGKSIAEAMGRQFARLSLGGIRDEAEIRGHRRTYIGAMPGRIIQTMKRVGTVNPLIMLDEIDKVGNDYRGDPTSALLEVLDPEQNNSFSDHYLDLPYDLSKVMFITTANLLDTIPPALTDRMEVIEFSGYIDQEKQVIAKKFLIPRHFDEHGLTNDELAFSDKAIQKIIHNYTYESGVRNLDREIGRICRKQVRRLGQGKKSARMVTPKSLARYLGPSKYSKNLLDQENQVGVATGLAWTSGGGDILPVEVSLYQGTGKLTLTGQLGDIMQESVQAALSFTKANAQKYKIDPKKFEKTDIHIHIPEGATPKDGPSAGITMVTALVSAFSGRKIKRTVGMTGEVTLRGRVLAIGGLRIKVMAAHRAGIKTVIIPEKNRQDLAEIPAGVRKNIDFELADSMDVVLKSALE